jgi:hypothetical protein
MNGLTAVFLLLLTLSGGHAGDITCQRLNTPKTGHSRASWNGVAARPQSMQKSWVAKRQIRLLLDSLRFPIRPQAATESLAIGQPMPAEVAKAPFNAAGRLFFTNRFGSTDGCAAAFVGDPTVLLTAAHCVQARSGEFYKGLVFSRAYDDGAGELFEVSLVATFNEWVNDPKPTNFEHDYAFLRTSIPVHGVTPLKFASSSSSHWFALAYPATVDGGKKMMIVKGTRGTSGRMIVMEDNPLDHGSSGGPWILADADGRIGQSVLSVASVLGPDRNTLLGPILTEQARTLFDFVRNGCK